jgi:hypothetical protein
LAAAEPRLLPPLSSVPGTLARGTLRAITATVNGVVKLLWHTGNVVFTIVLGAWLGSEVSVAP